MRSGPTLISEKHSSSSETTEVTPPSPKTLRNRDLASVLFGKEEEGVRGGNTSEVQGNSPGGPGPGPESSTPTPLSPQQSPPFQTHRNQSMPKLLQTPQEEAKLAHEVQQRMDAATLALKSPSKDSTDPYATLSRNGTISKKRINPNQISNPRLVSASTSVDTVPVRTPSLSSGPSKIGSRFKKLAGTLRAKNNPSIEDETIQYTSPSHPPVQVAHYDSTQLRVTGVTIPSSATETRFKVPVSSPPASAGPGLKGFMARLRGKPRVPDNSSQSDLRNTPPLISPVSATQLTPQVDSTPIRAPRSTPKSPDTPYLPTTRLETSPSPESSSSADPDDTLKQFIDAANKMGIDQGELNAFLARKGSTTSKHLLTQTDSGVTGQTVAPVDNSRLTALGPGSVDEQSLHAVTSEPQAIGRSTSIHQTSRDRPASRQHSRGPPEPIRRPPREGQIDRTPSAIIRRTIIFPDSKMTAEELAALMGKNPSGRQRGSYTSGSSRSIHDRAPTPPPPRSPTFKRFSNGPAPPVPSLPSNLALAVPADGAVEKSNSTYDSL